MTNLEKIHIAQEKTAQMQEKLDEAQSVLDKAEKVAEAEEVARSHAKQIIVFVAMLGIAAGAFVVIRKRRRKRHED